MGESNAIRLPKLEEVFTVTGVPTYTFVRPTEYSELLVALRTAGRGIVVEGPSGIGKTSAVDTALAELEMNSSVLKLSARRRDDRELIAALPEMGDIGVVVVDDFHRLPDDDKQRIADYMKTLADEGNERCKVVIIGINKAGESLIRFARDLNNRVSVIPFEANPEELVSQVVANGEEALNLRINTRNEIVRASHGSFYLAQMLSHQTCLSSSILQAQPETVLAEI